MFDDVPEPVWKTSTGKWSSQPPAATSAAASWIGAGDVLGDDLQPGVHHGRRPLDGGQGGDEGALDGQPGDGEVLDGPLGLRLPVGVDGHPDLTHGVVLDAVVAHRLLTLRPPVSTVARSMDRRSSSRSCCPSGITTTRPTGCSRPTGVSTFDAGGRTLPPGRARGAHRSSPAGDVRHRPPAAARPPRSSCGAILDDPEASANDRFVALDLLKNADIAAGGVLPRCQDTGTAIVMGKKGQRVITGGDDEAAIARGIFAHLRRRPTCATRRWRRSPCGTRSTPGTNLPAQIELYATPRRRLQVPLHGQGRRLGQQELPVPGDQGACSTRPA